MHSFIRPLRITKTFPLLSFLFTFLLSNFLINAQTLNGTYTVDVAGGPFNPGVNNNFPSLSEAVDSLNNMGISGHVVFDIADGSYSGQYTINSITGSGPSATVTFQAAGGDSNRVFLSYAMNGDADNYIFKIEEVSYITFRHLNFDATLGNTGYGRALEILGTTNNLEVLNNVFVGKTSGSSSSNSRRTLLHSWQNEFTDIRIMQNVFSAGENGIVLSGTSGNPSTGIEISDNEFYDQLESSLYMRYMYSPLVRNNHIRNEITTGKTGIYSEFVDQAAEFTGNIIFNQHGYAGIYLNSCDGNPGNEILVANNFITTHNNSSGTNLMGLYLNNSTRIKIYHNSIYNKGSWNASSECLYQGGSHSNLDIQNNNLVNLAGGYALYFSTNSPLTASDHNNYFIRGNFLGRWNGEDLHDLTSVSNRTGGDGNSISVNPVFVSEDDLHTTIYTLEGKGADLTPDVPFDIDGETRNSSFPDIGADEFTGAGAPMSGIYTIGGSNPDFPDLPAAVDSINKVGLSASVTFNIRDAGSPYLGTASIRPITGAGPGKRLTIQPDPANTGEVILTFDGSNNNNRVIELSRASYVTIKNLTLTTSNSSRPTVIRLNGMSRYDSIVNCKIVSIGTTSSNACIYSVDDIIGDIAIIGNEITDGYSGIQINGIDWEGWYPQNITIKDNIFSGHYANGVYLSDCNAPEIINNTISPGSSTYNWWGIYLYRNTNDYKILRNRVLNSVDDGGIVVYECNSSSTFRGLIANNYVQMSGTETQTNIHTLNTNYVDVFHNTCLVMDGNSGSSVFNNNNGSNVRVKNNNFINFGSGVAYYTNSETAITESDYNNLFGRANVFAHWGSADYSNLVKFQAGSGSDLNSISVNPWMAMNDYPDIRSSFVNNKGASGTGISTDFYGAVRGGTPDIGAVEFTPVSVPLAGSYTVGGTSPDFSGIREAMDSLMLKGISAPVTFNIRSGNYAEYIGSIYTIPGASSADTVIITSETGNAEDVVVGVTTDNTSFTNIFNFKSVSHFTLKNLTISAQGTSAGRPLGIFGTFENVNVIDNILTSANTSWAVLNISGVHNKISVLGNTISKGYRGINFYGVSTDYAENSILKGNLVSGGSYEGMRLEYLTSPMVTENHIESPAAAGYTGIWLINCDGDMRVTKNSVFLPLGDKGIFIDNCHAVNPYYGLIANNEILVKYTSSSYIYGIQVSNSDRINVYHNSVISNSSYSQNRDRAIEVWNTNNEIDIRNNIFASLGNGLAISVQDPNDVTSIDHNNIWSETGLVYWGGTTYSTLNEVKTGTGLADNTISADPEYFSETDLRNSQQGHYQAGTALLSFVPDDITGLPRDPSTPDLGAYKLNCNDPEFNVWVSPTCFGDSTIIIDSSTNILPGSFRGWDFTGDLVADVITENDYDTIVWHFKGSGNHTVTYIVQQVPDCNNFINLDVFVTPSPQLEITTKGAYCDTADGSASISVSNIPGPFKYYWTDADGKRLDQSDSTATGLAMGRYNVTVTSQNGCVSDTGVVIGEAIVATVTATKTSNCGVADGAATVSASGGVEPYRFVWSNGDTTETNSLLAPGSHYVNVIDKNGCYAQGSVDIKSVGGPQVTLEKQVNNDCYAERRGRLEISVSGGAAPYSVLWSNGETALDIDSLYAGIYNVRVKDSDGCVGAGSFQIHQPSQISISPVVTPATCKGSDGTAVAVTGGGTKPYIYEWSTGGVFQIEEGLAAGVYSVTATDSKGCKMVQPVIVNDVGAPDVFIDNVTGVGCKTTDNGAIDISVSPANPFYSYNWSNGQNIPNITGLTIGTYEVTVTNQDGCKGFATAEVGQDPPQVNPICLVTVDTSSGMNLVVWEKSVTTDVSHYNIYRESSVRNDFQLLASIPVDELSEFTDSVADPTVRSWRYRMSVVDECGNESELSPVHKTIHLTMNLGLVGNTVNLLWDRYEGFSVPTYKILRAVSDLPITSLTDLPSTSSSYTDDVTALGDDLYYLVEVLAPGDGCTSEDRKAATLNATRSNRKTKLKATTDIKDYLEISNLSVYPNPSPGIFNLSMDLGTDETVNMKVFNSTGQLIMVKEFVNQYHSLDTRIDLTEQSSGMYHIYIKTNKAILHRILIKE